MIATTKCKTCGDMNGYFTQQSNPSEATFAYCRCRPEGWEVCRRHKGSVRRRHRSVRVINAQGEYRYFSVYAMMAPCREDTCMRPSLELLKALAELTKLKQHAAHKQSEL